MIILGISVIHLYVQKNQRQLLELHKKRIEDTSQ